MDQATGEIISKTSPCPLSLSFSAIFSKSLITERAVSWWMISSHGSSTLPSSSPPPPPPSAPSGVSWPSGFQRCPRSTLTSQDTGLPPSTPWMSERHWPGGGSSRWTAEKRYSGSVKLSQSKGEAGNRSPSEGQRDRVSNRDLKEGEYEALSCFSQSYWASYWSQWGFCGTVSLLMGASSPRRFRPASLPASGRRRPSLELSSGDASPARLGGTRNFVPPWLNEPKLFVSYEVPHLHPGARSGCRTGNVRQVWKVERTFSTATYVDVSVISWHCFYLWHF